MFEWLSGLLGQGKQGSEPSGKSPIGNGLRLPPPTTASPPPAPLSLADTLNQPLKADHLASIIGKDDLKAVRSVTDKPWCAVCYLKCVFGTKTFIGTGWLINAATVITAGHNLWNPPFDSKEPDRAVGDVTSITVVPAHLEEGNEPFGSLPAARWVYDKRWMTKPNPDRRYYDYGAIFLEKPGFDLPFYFKPWHMPPADWKTKVLNCAGFPVKKNGRFVAAAGNACSATTGGSMFLGPQQEMVIHDIDTGGGESGGPIFMYDGEDYFVLGVHTQGVGLVAGRNAGVRITDKMIESFKLWSKDTTLQGPQTV